MYSLFTPSTLLAVQGKKDETKSRHWQMYASRKSLREEGFGWCSLAGEEPLLAVLV